MKSPPTLKPEPPPQPQLQPHTLSPSSSGRRSSTDTNSPEFEFWMLRNPSLPQPHLLSADELFVDGVLLPLQLLHIPQPDPTPQPDLTPEPESIQSEQQKPISERLVPDSESESGPEISAGSCITVSKRWTDIFKKIEKKNGEERDRGKEKKKSERKRKGNNSNSGSGSGSAELNINIWPFSRSKSAGNNNGRQRGASTLAASRKVSSAPCSRSNSGGESKSRKWPSSPGRVGVRVHLGRSSPAWQVRRGSGMRVSEPAIRSAEKGVKKEGLETRRSNVGAATESSGGDGGSGDGGGGGARAGVLNLNVPLCIGYRPHLSCRTDENSTIGGGGDGGGSDGSGGGGGGGGGQRGGGANVSGGSNLFNLRNLFTKKVY